SPTGTQTVAGVIGDDTGSAAAAGYGGPAGYTKGHVGLTVDGTGTLLLNAINTYSGGTTVNAGTLGGTGTIRAVTVNSGGTLAPGASAGIFHTGNASFGAGAHFAVELGGTSAGVNGYDQLAVTGTVALGGATLDLSLVNGFTPAIGNHFRII